MEEQRLKEEYVDILIEKLREYSIWAEENQWEVPIALPEDLADAANIIESLLLIVRNGRNCSTCLHYKGFHSDGCNGCNEYNCNWEWVGVRTDV